MHCIVHVYYCVDDVDLSMNLHEQQLCKIKSPCLYKGGGWVCGGGGGGSKARCSTNSYFSGALTNCRHY